MNGKDAAILVFWIWLLATMAFLAGAEASLLDCRNHGYDVPHLWQPFKKK